MTPEKYKELSIKEFTQAAKVYDSGHAGIYEMCKDDYPSILAELEKEKFHDVLDCGCGTGPMIQLLHDKYPEKHYVGLDLTPEMIKVAHDKKLSNTEFIVGDSENLPFGHGDVKIYKVSEFVAMSEKAGFKVMTMEKQKGFRAHLVVRKQGK